MEESIGKSKVTVHWLNTTTKGLPMNETYRHKQLLSLLEEKKILSTNEIIDLLGVSPATARRDISKLHEQGKLRKVRNGAEAIETDFTQFSQIKSTTSARNNGLPKRQVNTVLMVQV